MKSIDTEKLLEELEFLRGVLVDEAARCSKEHHDWMNGKLRGAEEAIYHVQEFLKYE